MRPVELKNILYSLVEPQHQTFDVRFVPETKKGPLGTYLRKTRLITIYPKQLQSRFELLGTGLHELAHHLTSECDGHVYALSDLDGKHVQHHGKEFSRHLKALVTEFNVRYGDRVKGLMFCSSRRASRSPGFVRFSELDRRINTIYPDFLVADVTLSSQTAKNRLRAKPGRRVVMIGFNGRKEAVMYSKHTRKFDYKVPTDWMNLLCRYAAAAPKPGELWEFGVAARRVLDASGKKAS
jgi:hypothetical protein